MQKLPPLAGFKAFEAAARFQSFTKAADELNVTQAAVSQQIKQLEYHLGFDLFSRRPRQIALTEKGAALAHVVRKALEDIGENIARLQSNAHEETLRISVVPSFAMLWLIPRIAGFSACHPNIDLRIDTTEEYVDLAKDGYDLVIRITNMANPGLDCKLLSKGLAVPVYSPKLVKADVTRLDYSDLRCFTLLHRGDTELWRRWLRQQGLLSENCNFGSSYNRAGPLVAAAIAGQGVAMVPAMLASYEIEQGNLVILDPVGIETESNTYLMGLKDTVDKPAIVAFRAWMTKQMAMSKSHFACDAGLS